MSREKADNQKLTEIELRRLQHNLTCRRGSTREKTHYQDTTPICKGSMKVKLLQ